MALSSLSQFTLSPSPIPKITTHPNTPTTKSTLTFTTTNWKNKTNRLCITVKAGEERQQEKPTTQDSPNAPSDEEQTELGNEIKKAMMERQKKEDESLFGGVAAEIGKIEWPAFNKVVGTTGVVLGVIAGSSVVLLTLNAVLAEVSDRVFAGRGVQDFFG
nr:preprotein translocase subunit SECE1 [Tanacetum cinerariifolium]